MNLNKQLVQDQDNGILYFKDQGLNITHLGQDNYTLDIQSSASSSQLNRSIHKNNAWWV